MLPTTLSRSLRLALAGVPPLLAAQERVLLRDVQVVDVEAGRLLRDHSVLIEGGRIVALARDGALETTAGMTVVEGEGRFLLPGLCDMHVHLHEVDAEEALLLFVANGVTTVQSMHGSPWHLGLRERVARGEVLGPRIFTTGPTTATLGVHDPEHAERVAREQASAGYDGIKMYGDGSNTMPRETYHRLIASAHELGLRVVGHAPRNLPFSAVLEEGQDSIDHLEELVYTDEGLGKVVQPYVDLQFGRARFEDRPELLGEVPDFREPLAEAVNELAGRVRAAGLHVTPTLVTFSTIQRTTDEGFPGLLAQDELRYVHPAQRLAWEAARFRSGNWKPHLAFMASYLQRNVELQMALAAAFHAAGVPLMPGTDAPFDFVVPGFSLHDELAFLVRCGLTPLEALRAATLVPARFLRVDRESGSVAPAKRADLVLVEGNPLEDIAASARVWGVFVNGRWLPRDELDERLTALAARHGALEERVRGLASDLAAGRFVEALARYRAEPAGDRRLADWLEGRINAAGYELLRAKRLDEALALFRLNTETFPEAFNTWDSLGEACLEKGDRAEAIRHYERSLELDPANGNARRMIDRIVAERPDARPQPR